MGFGLWPLSTSGWSSGNREEGSVNLIRSAFDVGVTLFDTADSYSKGYSEELLFESLGSVRKEIVISTKLGFDFYPPDIEFVKSLGSHKPKKNFDPDYIAFACEQSLKRLNTDYIDLLSLHYPTVSDAEQDYVFEQLERLVEDGKILHWGAALDDSENPQELVEILINDRESAFLHIPCNIFEKDLLDMASQCCEEKSVGIISRRPHFYGFLESDTVTDIELLLSEDSQSYIDNLPNGAGGRLEQCAEFIRICSVFGVAPNYAAMRYVLDIPAVCVTIPNIRDMKTLVDFCVDFESDAFPTELTDALADLF